MTGEGLESVAARLARLLVDGGERLSDGQNSELCFEPDIEPRPLGAGSPPIETWAVDGGQALVADARCLQVYVTRAAKVCFRDGACVVEEEGQLQAHLLGAGQGPTTLAEAGLELSGDTPADVNLLRDWAEWSALAECCDRAAPGALLLVDGDLVPDWRLPPSVAAEPLEQAATRGLSVAGVTKHSSLSRGGAPLVGQLELEAAEALGPRARWWAPVARTRQGSLWPDLQVVVAKLDPDARYAFRIDIPAGLPAEEVLGTLAWVSDDAAFPGYPYPLSVADRLAACPGWLRQEAWLVLDQALERAGVPGPARERAFDDRHRLMERA
ncbi:MAG TPA: DNA double-strand break repair nuclease NurA [Acidimicrobiales bacterium]|nr:DNA double-strand break repair nuclease NurA [Acidimicrobiales bacterium]